MFFMLGRWSQRRVVRFCMISLLAFGADPASLPVHNHQKEGREGSFSCLPSRSIRVVRREKDGDTPSPTEDAPMAALRCPRWNSPDTVVFF